MSTYKRMLIIKFFRYLGGRIGWAYWMGVLDGAINRGNAVSDIFPKI